MIESYMNNLEKINKAKYLDARQQRFQEKVVKYYIKLKKFTDIEIAKGKNAVEAVDYVMNSIGLNKLYSELGCNDALKRKVRANLLEHYLNQNKKQTKLEKDDEEVR